MVTAHNAWQVIQQYFSIYLLYANTRAKEEKSRPTFIQTQYWSLRIASKNQQKQSGKQKRTYQEKDKYNRHPNPIRDKKKVFQCAHNFSKVGHHLQLKQDIIINPNLAAWLKTS